MEACSGAIDDRRRRVRRAEAGPESELEKIVEARNPRVVVRAHLRQVRRQIACHGQRLQVADQRRTGGRREIHPPEEQIVVAVVGVPQAGLGGERAQRDHDDQRREAVEVGVELVAAARVLVIRIARFARLAARAARARTCRRSPPGATRQTVDQDVAVLQVAVGDAVATQFGDQLDEALLEVVQRRRTRQPLLDGAIERRPSSQGILVTGYHAWPTRTPVGRYAIWTKASLRSVGSVLLIAA